MTELAEQASVETAADEALDLRMVDAIVAEKGRHRGATIPILQAIQEHFRYLPHQALVRVCEKTDIRPAQLEGIATFYSQFRRKPVGKHIVSVCIGTACHVAGAKAIIDSLLRHLDIPEGQDTDADGLWTVEEVACLGCCSLAPVARIGERFYGYLTQETAPKMLEHFLREEAAAEGVGVAPGGAKVAGGQDGDEFVEIRLGLDSACIASGSGRVRQAFQDEIRRLGAPARVRGAACAGMYYHEPLVEVVKGDRRIRYAHVTPEMARHIARRHLRPSGLARKGRAAFTRALELLTDDMAWKGPEGHEIGERDEDLRAFLSKQKHIVMEGAGDLDPDSLADYEAHGGYQALKTVLAEGDPEQLIRTVEEAGLRGRGGGGYPTGLKWNVVREQAADKKYVVVNADEGDPGAFMDRLLLESYPHRVLEGLTIAAYAVGASEGYVYVRAEYPLAVRRIRRAIEQATESGYLGESILGTGFSLHVGILEGAGAFVCGEETALIASLEGRRGMPRYRPPYPVVRGLWGWPTSVNNVETYANVPWIVRNGPEAFSSLGTEKSNGTKAFALAGRVRRGGLIEVPMGITVGEIVDEIGGGVPEGHRLKAVQIGGPSGGCLPALMRDVKIDYEDLTRHGAMMGSGGLVVMDETTCMVDIARYFLEFTQKESCGKCTFCRVGTKRLLEILERLCAGEGKAGDIELLEDLAGRIRRTSLCALGQSAPNPVLTTLKYFRDEYEAHVEGHCPAGLCLALIRYEITDECYGCTLCAQKCPADAIEICPYEQHEIDQDKCIHCGGCMEVCPADAVIRKEGKE
jgi:NADH-quinone oxidoreductase subunit F